MRLSAKLKEENEMGIDNKIFIILYGVMAILVSNICAWLVSQSQTYDLDGMDKSIVVRQSKIYAEYRQSKDPIRKNQILYEISVKVARVIRIVGCTIGFTALIVGIFFM